MFTELVNTLVENGKGIHAYRKCSAKARELAVASPNHAACYFLIAALAEDFVELNERMAITAAQTNAVFERFVDTTALLEDALKNGDSSKMLTVLNHTALELTKSGRQSTQQSG